MVMVMSDGHPISPHLGQPVTVVRTHKLSAPQTAFGRAADCLDKLRLLCAGSAKPSICLPREDQAEGRYLLEHLVCGTLVHVPDAHVPFDPIYAQKTRGPTVKALKSRSMSFMQMLTILPSTCSEVTRIRSILR